MTSENGTYNHTTREGADDNSAYVDSCSKNQNSTQHTKNLLASTHTIAKGGDNETRPINIYVNYIIILGLGIGCGMSPPDDNKIRDLLWTFFTTPSKQSESHNGRLPMRSHTLGLAQEGDSLNRGNGGKMS